MEEILDALADELAGRVLEKLLETQRMKDFLANKLPPSSIDAEDVTGLIPFVEDIVDTVLAKQDAPTIDVDNVDGLEKYVEEKVGECLEKATISVDRCDISISITP